MREREERSAPFAKALRREMTDAEKILWSRLNKRAQQSMRFRRQHALGPYVADFACIAARLIVEIDGATHGEDAQIAHDERRNAYLARKGWLVIRFTNDDVYRRLNMVLDGIWITAEFRRR